MLNVPNLIWLLVLLWSLELGIWSFNLAPLFLTFAAQILNISRPTGIQIKPMKISLLSITTIFALALSSWAADVKLTDVHICCPSCVKGVATATAPVTGLKAVASQDDSTISLSAPDTATLQKGVDALTAAGYFGKSSDPAIKVNAATGAKDQKVKELKIEDLHLCCNSCVKSVNRVLGGVSGVSTNNATKGAKVFTVTGDFNDKEVMNALQGAGLTGKVAK